MGEVQADVVGEGPFDEVVPKYEVLVIGIIAIFYVYAFTISEYQAPRRKPDDQADLHDVLNRDILDLFAPVFWFEILIIFWILLIIWIPNGILLSNGIERISSASVESDNIHECEAHSLL